MLNKGTDYLERSFKSQRRSRESSSVDKQTRTSSSDVSELEEVGFVFEKVSERHVKKYNANSCVFRACIENDKPRNVKVKDVIHKLS